MGAILSLEVLGIIKVGRKPNELCLGPFVFKRVLITFKSNSIFLYTVPMYFFGSSEEDEVSDFFVLSHLWMRG